MKGVQKNVMRTMDTFPTPVTTGKPVLVLPMNFTMTPLARDLGIAVAILAFRLARSIEGIYERSVMLSRSFLVKFKNCALIKASE